MARNRRTENLEIKKELKEDLVTNLRKAMTSSVNIELTEMMKQTLEISYENAAADAITTVSQHLRLRNKRLRIIRQS